MKIGIGLPNNIRGAHPTVIPAWAAKAEQAGFATLGSVGRIAYPGVMDTVALAAAAGATSRIGLLSSILVAPAWPAALLAKEAAGIDGVSGGRLTLGLGVGDRPDDFVVDGHGVAGRGKRLDRDLEVYRDIWRGGPVGGGENPAVSPSGAREIPLLFGASTPAAFERMARWGQGYIGPALPPEVAKSFFDSAREAWQRAGRPGSPRLVGVSYFSLGDPDKGRENVRNYASVYPSEVVTMVTEAIRDNRQAVKEVVEGYAGIGADEFIFATATDDIDEVSRLADIVL